MSNVLKVLVCGAMVLGLTACGKTDGSKTKADKTAATSGKAKTGDKKSADKKAAPAAGDTAGLDAGQKFLLERGQKSLGKVKAALKEGKKVQLVDCAMVRGAIKKLDGNKNAAAAAFVKDGDKTCNYDVLIAGLKTWKAEVETEAKAGKKLNPKCYDRRKKDLEKLQKSHPEDKTVKDVAAYIATTCAKK